MPTVHSFTKQKVKILGKPDKLFVHNIAYELKKNKCFAIICTHNSVLRDYRFNGLSTLNTIIIVCVITKICD